MQHSERKLDLGIIRGQDGGGDAVAGSHHQDPAVRRVNVEEQSIVQREMRQSSLADNRKEQGGVCAIGVVIDQLASRVYDASTPIAAEVNEAVGVLCNGILMRAQFVPSDVAVTVVIKMQHEVEITQGDVPLGLHDCHLTLAFAPILHRQGQERIACGMCVDMASQQHARCKGGQAPHQAEVRFAVRSHDVDFGLELSNCASSRARESSTGSCSFVWRRKVKTGAAA